MMNKRPISGFILIEIIFTLILIGVIGVFTGFFLYTGVSGYLTTQKAAEGALSAQLALDRISLELRNINELPSASPPAVDTSITYRCSDLPDTRGIRHDAGTIYIRIDRGGGDVADYTLLEDVTNFTLNWETADLDDSGDGNLEVSGINVGFGIDGLDRTFAVRIFPRHLIPSPS